MVAANAETPGFRAAHLVGGITAMPGCDALFQSPRTLICIYLDNESPMVQQQDRSRTFWKRTWTDWRLKQDSNQLASTSPEAVPESELAFHFTVESSIYDPDGWLSDLSRQVIPRHADREWVTPGLRMRFWANSGHSDCVHWHRKPREAIGRAFHARL
ncbi:MAG: hypothetical protein R2855_02685 [Thermomicrobiales bacterium]